MEILKHNQTRHGYHGSPVYKVWASMVKRCETSTSSNYSDYGKRGIKVCNEWRKSPKAFCDWAIQNGYKQGLEIDRIDNERGYYPDNCQFVTHKENCAPHKRRIRKYNKSGERNICQTKSGKFEAYAYVDGKQKFIGTYKTIDDAITAREETEIKVIGNIHDNPELLEGAE